MTKNRPKVKKKTQKALDYTRKVISLIAKIKKKHPGLRIGQIIVNAWGSDPYYAPDDILAYRLEIFLNQYLRG